MKKIFCLIAFMILVVGCSIKQPPEEEIALPYPPDSDMPYYQAQSDSGFQKFWTDLRATSSAFLNNSKYEKKRVEFNKIKVIHETSLNGQVSVEFDDMILQLTLNRKFKALGAKSVWQVIGASETPWPKSNSK